MRIRTLLTVSAALAGVLAVVILAGLLCVTHQAQLALEEANESQEVARDVANMLALTNEFTVYGGERAAGQWRARLDQLRSAVDAAVRHRDTPAPELLELQRNVADLPLLFDPLVQIGLQPASSLSQRRRDLLIERLLTETQEVVESRHRWALVLGQAQQRDQRRYALMVIAAPGALLLLLVALGAVVSRRVLAPLARLESAARALRGGDLSVRCATDARDELGDAARAVDEMATALQQQSAALRASEHRLRLLTDSLPVAITHVDTAQRSTFLNKQVRRVLGGEPQVWMGQTIRQSIGEEAHRRLEPHLLRALAGERVDFEDSALVDGALLHLATTFIPDVDDTGRVQGLYSMVFDITARKNAELQQATSEQRLLDLINSLPAMVGYFDMEERCLYANDMALQTQGMERADLARLTLRDTLGEATYAEHEPCVRDVLRGHRSRFESRMRFHGRDAHLQTHFIADRVEGGAQRGFYAMTFDITALKEAQQRQALVERQLRRISDNLPVLISYLDHEERYLFANATYRSWLGFDPPSLIGQRIADQARPEHYEQRRGPLQRALAGERVEFNVDSEMLGVQRSLKIVYVPDVQADGSVAGVFALSTDVSALKAIEQQLASLARRDTLTSLPNRRHFEERLGEAVGRAARSMQPIALMFLDVDHFKRINDTFGHAAGDAVLKEFGGRLRDAVRSTDFAARLAGDEFVVLLENVAGAEDAEQVAQKVVAAMRSPFLFGDTMLQVTTSLGVAYCAHSPSEIGLMARADEALYQAKAAGRNTFIVGAFDAVVTQ